MSKIAPLLAVTGVFASILIAGCSSSTSSTGTSSGTSTSSSPSGGTTSPATGSSSSTSATSATLPAAIKSKGYIANLVNTPNPPMEFTNGAGGTLTGFDIDLANALSTQLGFPIHTTQTPNFNELIPAVQSGRTDIVLSAISDLDSRQPVVSFVDYFSTGTVFLLRAADLSRYPTLASLCGHTVVASTGTSYPADVMTFNKTVCSPAGSPAMKILEVGSTPDQLAQLATDRADAVLENVEVAAYQVQQNPTKYSVQPVVTNRGNYGIIFPKQDPALGTALQTALQALIANGTYATLLSKWQLSSGAVSSATINHGADH